MAFAVLRGRLRRRRANLASAGADTNSSPEEKASAARKKERKKKLLLNTVDLLKEALRMLYDSADACPPLKSAVGGVTHIVNNIEKMHGNGEETQRIVKRVEKLVELIDAHFSRLADASGLLHEAVSLLNSEMEQLVREIDELPESSLLMRYFTASKKNEQLVLINLRLDSAVQQFEIAISFCNQASISLVQSTTNRTELAVHSLRTELAQIRENARTIAKLAVFLAFN